jgi:hypothetical protein
MVTTSQWSDTGKRHGLFLYSLLLTLWIVPLTLRPVLASEPSPSFTLKIEGSMVQLKADGVPLNNILDAIAAQSDIKLRATEQTTELIYCHLTRVPLVETLKKLLRNWNFALIYKGNSNDTASPDTLWVIGKNPHTDLTVPVYLVNTEDREGAPLQDHQKRFEKNALTAVFADSTKVMAGFTAEDHFNFMNSPDPLPLSQCLQIKTLSTDSAIREIGLQEGDLVMNVNGQHVTTAAELLEAIKKATQQETPNIRIDRRHNDIISPIYIETY